MKSNYIIGIIITIVSGLGCYFGLKSLIQSRSWSAEDRKEMLKRCIEREGTNAIQYPKSTQTYCECAYDKITTKYSISQYNKLHEKSYDEMMDSLLLVVQDCRIKYNKDMLEEMGTTALPFIDTTITLQDISTTDIIKEPLTNQQAKKTLYKYFKKRGVVPQDQLEGDAYKQESIMCIEYDTIYHLNLKPKISTAVISYWLVPAHGRGHCFQPRRAIISRKGTDYQISNLDFIPASFLIDSVGTDATLFISDFDCGKNEVLKNIKLKLLTQ